MIASWGISAIWGKAENKNFEQKIVEDLPRLDI
jgi:hypothetical protein